MTSCNISLSRDRSVTFQVGRLLASSSFSRCFTWLMTVERLLPFGVDCLANFCLPTGPYNRRTLIAPLQYERGSDIPGAMTLSLLTITHWPCIRRLENLIRIEPNSEERVIRRSTGVMFLVSRHFLKFYANPPWGVRWISWAQ